MVLIHLLQICICFTTVSHILAYSRNRRIITTSNQIPATTFSPHCDFLLNLTDVKTRPIIQTPNYPGNYWPRLRCRWTIKSKFGYQIRLVFDSFVLQPPHFHSGCVSDYLQITDTSGVTRLCGVNAPSSGSYLSVGPQLELIFVSDGAWEYPGISLRANMVQISCGGFAINPKPGLIKSPNNPQIYLSDTVCAWSITVSANRLVRLNCSKSFVLEYAQDCLADFLLISATGDESMTAATRYCGKSGPRVITTSGNKLFIMFRSDSWHNFAGFSCRYETVEKNGKPTISSSGNNTTLQKKCECGKINTRHKRIVGGELMSKSLPWLVAITSRQGQLFCGGVLIAPTIVLTAGHCLNGLTASNISVAVETYRPQWWAMNHLLPVEKVIVHPRLKRFDYDAALLTIPNALPKEKERVCACLPMNNVDLVGRKADVYGWGRDVRSRDDRLRRVAVPILNDTSCKNVFSKLIQITPRMMCAGEDGKDACEGDSGGPLLLDEDGRQTVVGLVSFGLGCGAPGYPGVYTKVPQLVKWIREKANITCR